MRYFLQSVVLRMHNQHNIIFTILFFFSFFAYVPGEMKMLQYVTIVILLFHVLIKGSFPLRKFRKLNTALFVFLSIVLISGIVGDIKYGHYAWHVNVTSSILFVFQVLTLFGHVEYVISKNLQTIFIKQLIQILGLFLIINDLHIFLNIKNIYDVPDNLFFLGSKFGVSYSHLLFCALLFTYNTFSMIWKIVLLLFCAFISKIVFCSTGLIGSFSFIVLYLFEKIGGKLLYKRFVFLMSIIASVCFSFVIILIMSSPWFLSFMEMLGESSILTGRTNIYIHLADIISASPFFGYGNGNSQMYVIYYTDVGNAQNGILADIVDWGIIGTISFLSIPYGLLKNTKYSRYSYPLLCLLYTYIIVGMVEITMGVRFIAALSLFLLPSVYFVDDRQFKRHKIF